MSALFYFFKAICWLIIGVIIDLMLGNLGIQDRIAIFVGVCLGVFLFEATMDKTGGNKKLSQLLKDR